VEARCPHPDGRSDDFARGKEVVGMMATSIDDQGLAWIDHLYLVGQGIGSELLAPALKTLSRPIRLYTFEANHVARRFYGRQGFVPVRYGDGSSNEEGCQDVRYELS
jgi:GNAT superfamily N-acetyltransferase